MDRIGWVVLALWYGRFPTFIQKAFACGAPVVESHPERFEHFGITTVEAMAAGCVPVVIGKGGQPEIVQHERNGMLWRTMDEMKQEFWRLFRDEKLRRQLAIAAREDSQRFGQPRFERELQSLLGQIGVD